MISDQCGLLYWHVLFQKSNSFYMHSKKRKNFITNQELLANFRNRSLCVLPNNPTLNIKKGVSSGPEKKLSRHQSSQFTIKTNIDMPERQKRTRSVQSLYEHCEKKAISQANNKQQKYEQTFTFQQVMLVAKQIGQTTRDANIAQTFQYKLNRLHNIKQRYNSKAQPNKTSQNNEAELMKKLEQLYKDKRRLKKQNKTLQSQVRQLQFYRNKQHSNTQNDSRINNRIGMGLYMQQYPNAMSENRKYNQNQIPAMIMKQSQLIDLQNKQYFQSTENMRRMLLTQAKIIEQMPKKTINPQNRHKF